MATHEREHHRPGLNLTRQCPLPKELYERVGLPNSTGSYHLRQLREAGVTRARANGPKRMISLRREDLESRFPGLVELITAAPE